MTRSNIRRPLAQAACIVLPSTLCVLADESLATAVMMISCVLLIALESRR